MDARRHAQAAHDVIHLERLGTPSIDLHRPTAGPGVVEYYEPSASHVGPHLHFGVGFPTHSHRALTYLSSGRALLAALDHRLFAHVKCWARDRAQVSRFPRDRRNRGGYLGG